MSDEPSASVDCDSDPVRRTAAAYSDEAPTYLKYFAPRLLPYSFKLVDQLSLVNASLILDMGTGVGALLPTLRKRAPAALVIGADRSSGMLSLAPSGFPRVLCDASLPPFASDLFDVVTMCFMLFHLPDPGSGLREMLRILRPGGTLAIAVQGAQDRSFPAGEIWEEASAAAGAPDDPRIDTWESMNTREKMQTLVTEADFAPVRIWQEPRRIEWDVEKFFESRLGDGGYVRWMDSLEATARARFISEVRKRIEDAGRDALVLRGSVVYAIGEKPG